MDIPVPLLAGIGTAIGALIAIVIAIGKLAAKLAKIDRLESELKEHKSQYSDNRYDVNARIARTNGKVSAILYVFGPRLPAPSPIDPAGPT